MLMDDLLLYGRGDRELDRKVRNKCEADLVYYQIISHVINRYGVSGKRDVGQISADALCIARNQMAMLASDDRLLRYDSENRVEGFYNPGTGRYDRTFTDGSLRHFIRESILNSEAVRTTVAKSLASDPSIRGTEMTDDEYEARVDAEFESILDPDEPSSLFNAVLADARTFGNTMGVDNREYYAMNMPA
ncbi:MAG: hypothetical protein NC311_12510, partial [Muribaculaceae bacterium]|nr:hypothetical protein [Muribaculaceae bacterium]